MKDILKEAYDRCAPGSKGTVSAKGRGIADLEDFQVVKLVAEDMQNRGLIHIVDLRRESYTGQRYINAIVFLRL